MLPKICDFWKERMLNYWINTTNGSLNYWINTTNGSLNYWINTTNGSLNYWIKTTNGSLNYWINTTNRSLNYWWLGLWWLTPLSIIFQLYVGVSFIGEGYRRTAESHRPVTSQSQTLSHNVVYHIIRYTSTWAGFEITTLVVNYIINTVCCQKYEVYKGREMLKLLNKLLYYRL